MQSAAAANFVISILSLFFFALLSSCLPLCHFTIFLLLYFPPSLYLSLTSLFIFVSLYFRISYSILLLLSLFLNYLSPFIFPLYLPCLLCIYHQRWVLGGGIWNKKMLKKTVFSNVLNVFLDFWQKISEKQLKLRKRVKNGSKIVFRSAIGCALHPKAGQNTQHLPLFLSFHSLSNLDFHLFSLL